MFDCRNGARLMVADNGAQFRGADSIMTRSDQTLVTAFKAGAQETNAVIVSRRMKNNGNRFSGMDPMARQAGAAC